MKMSQQSFIIDDDILESALTGRSVDGNDENTCFMLMATMINDGRHRIVISRLVRRKYRTKIDELRANGTIRNHLIASLLPKLFVNSSMMQEIRDSEQIDPQLSDCENVILNLADDIPNAVIVTQNGTLDAKVSSRNPKPIILNPLMAIQRAQVNK